MLYPLVCNHIAGMSLEYIPLGHVLKDLKYYHHIFKRFRGLNTCKIVCVTDAEYKFKEVKAKIIGNQIKIKNQYRTTSCKIK